MDREYNVNGQRFRIFRVRRHLVDRGLLFNQQAAIYYACKNYFTLFNIEEKERFNKLLMRCCNNRFDYFDACFEYMTSELYFNDILAKYSVNKQVLYNYLDDFYMNFDYVKKVY